MSELSVGLGTMGRPMVARVAVAGFPMSALVREMWAAAQAMLGPKQDHTAAAQLAETLAGTELG